MIKGKVKSRIKWSRGRSSKGVKINKENDRKRKFPLKKKDKKGNG